MELQRSTGRRPNRGSKPRPAVPPPDSGDARSATKTAPKRLIFSRNDLQGMGNKSPLFLSPNLIQKCLDLKLPFLINFGHLEYLFIGIPEHPQALGRLVHCLKHIYLPQIGLDRALPDQNRHLQVSRQSAEFPTTLASNSGHHVRWSAKPLHKKCCPDTCSCNPAFQLAGKAAGRICLCQSFQNCTLAPKVWTFSFWPISLSPSTFLYCIQDPQVPKHWFDPRRFRKHLVSASL